MVLTTSPDTGRTSYLYDEVGNVVQKTDARGSVVEYTYDPLSRLKEARFSDPEEDITYTYDGGTYGIGRLTSITDPSGGTQFGYDSRGRLLQRTNSTHGVDYTLRYTYTPGGKVRSITYPSGRTLTSSRNSAGRIEEVTTTYEGVSSTLMGGISYYAFGPPAGMSFGPTDGTRSWSDGVVENEFGECGCITRSNSGKEKEMVYGYDANGNLTSIRGTNQPWLREDFSYDGLNRLVGASGRYGTIDYTYDRLGNRLTRTVKGETESYSYFPGTSRLKEITGGDPRTFGYDENGNITRMGEMDFFYNMDNRLIRVEKEGATIAEYTYNALGQRVSKEVDGNTTLFHYDFSGKLIAESLPDGTMTAEYLYMGKARVAKVDVLTGSLYYYLNNQLDTPQLMTDENGVVVWEGSYKPFGETRVNPSSTVVNNLRFPGQYYDEETGLHYNYHRYYSPRTGRYLTPDPIGLVGGINLFAYANNNPINLIDRLGLKVYTTLTLSAGGGFGILSGEGGTVLAFDISTGEVHSYRFVAYGLGLGFGGVVTAQVGRVDMNDPQDISGWGLEISAFSAAVHGVSGQITGTGPAGSGAGGGAVGYACGAGAGISGMGTYTWYENKYNLKNLPNDVLK